MCQHLSDTCLTFKTYMFQIISVFNHAWIFTLQKIFHDDKMMMMQVDFWENIEIYNIERWLWWITVTFVTVVYTYLWFYQNISVNWVFRCITKSDSIDFRALFLSINIFMSIKWKCATLHLSKQIKRVPWKTNKYMRFSLYFVFVLNIYFIFIFR